MNVYSQAVKVALHAIIPEEDRLPNACLARAVDEALSGQGGSSDGVAADSTCPLPRISLLKRKFDDKERVKEDTGGSCSKFRRTLSRSSKSYSSLSAVFRDDVESALGLGGSGISCSATSKDGIDGYSIVSPLSTATSLEFQLNYVSPDDSSGTCEAAPCIIFPNLPTTISDSSWSSAERSKALVTPRESDKIVDSEQDLSGSNERYGWFVVLDKDICDPRTGFSAYKSTMDDLAFSAPTAPIARGEEEEAELQWAQAADTVDDLLGDLF